MVSIHCNEASGRQSDCPISPLPETLQFLGTPGPGCDSPAGRLSPRPRSNPLPPSLHPLPGEGGGSSLQAPPHTGRSSPVHGFGAGPAQLWEDAQVLTGALPSRPGPAPGSVPPLAWPRHSPPSVPALLLLSLLRHLGGGGCCIYWPEFLLCKDFCFLRIAVFDLLCLGKKPPGEEEGGREVSSGGNTPDCCCSGRFLPRGRAVFLPFLGDPINCGC